jgi:diguanylate cyclase (GGDEF)-like protein
MLLTSLYLAASALLLWIGAEIGALAPGRRRGTAGSIAACALVLQSDALWWLTRALRIDGALLPASEAGSVPAGLLCLALPGFGWLTAQRLAARAPAQLMASAALTLTVAYALALVAMPGLFMLAAPSGSVGASIAVGALGLSAVTLHLQSADPQTARVSRIVSALAVAGIGALASIPASAAIAATVWSDLSQLGSVLAVAVALLVVLRPQTGPEQTRTVVRRTAAVDSLTGLPTRLFFEERMRAQAKRCAARRTQFAVLFIDLDGFKPVNDTFGHSCGDRVLRLVGRRLQSLTRRATGAARIGGDEFLLLVPDVPSSEAVALTAQRVIETLSRPYKVGEREITISCSIGIAVHASGDALEKLIARADVAMYAAKRAGGSRHCFYTAAMDSDAQQDFDLVRDLRKAIAKNELELYFQPKIDARSGKVTAAEALLRWHHPSQGMIMPDRFIQLAERTGLIGPLGNWVIEAACRQARQWRDKGLRMRVAINLSAHQMRQDDIAERIADALKRHRIDPSLLTCEITESAAMEDTGSTQETFRRLGELGAHLSIDDFGTGYSSLAYLRKLPAEELKIDRSFVMDLEHSADARAVVDAVLRLAHALGLKVVAEGVENQRQQQILSSLGCDELQGYLFARPMSARALLIWALGEGRQEESFNTSLFGVTREAAPTIPHAVAG